MVKVSLHQHLIEFKRDTTKNCKIKVLYQENNTKASIVEVFKTNVTEEKDAQKIVDQLHTSIPGSQVNFDLADCDNILRVECSGDVINEVSEVLSAYGYWGQPL